MRTTPLYEDEREQRLHHHAAQLIARDVGRSVSDVIPLYEEELDQLKGRAKIKDFLSVLVSQRVKEILLNRKAWH
jgi:hypothetical protein